MGHMAKKWNIKPEESGERLDVFLTSKIPSLTRSAIAKRLKAGAGLINGKKASVHAFLKTGQEVSFEAASKPRASLKKNVLPAGEKRRHFDLGKMIVEETPGWIVVNKPAGILVHPDTLHKDGTLVDLLIEHYPPLVKVGEDLERPGIVHRLDKEVSGLMVVAKTQDAFDGLKNQFSHHQTKKIYLALVQGAPPKEEGDIRFRIARSGTKARMAARPESESRGKAAWSHYKVIKKSRKYSLLQVEILSGRTHQIRAHLFALGCPVVGDQLYVGKDAKGRLGREGRSDRIMLQSVELTFNDPGNNEKLTFKLPPDPSFAEFI